MASVAGGIHPDVITAQRAMTSTKAEVYTPDAAAVAVYDRLFGLYRTLHDGFGTAAPAGAMNHVMKELLSIQTTARGEGTA
jgi:L-ribulokinase